MSKKIICYGAPFPHPLSTFLAACGYTVFEAETVDDIEQCSKNQIIDALLSISGPHDLSASDFEERTVRVDVIIHATSPEMFFELSNLLPTPASRPQ